MTPSDNFDFQNFFSATLTADITAATLTIPLDNVPTPSEGILVINPDSATPECIFYTSKGGSSVTCPAGGRGWDNTTAQSFLQGTTVIMAPTAYMLRMLKNGSLYDTTSSGWTTLGIAVASVVNNGQRSYDVTFNSTVAAKLTPGMRLRFQRTVASPTQCTSLNGTTQYWNDTTVAGMTFTDDFVVSAWVKLSSYAAGNIASRFNGTSGWGFYLTSSGQVTLEGYNAGGANASSVRSFQSIPLNRWVHITAQLDMSAFTATTTTSYVMIDGVDVPASVSRGGTNPTALVQAGNLEIGASNGGTSPFPGKLAQVAIFSAKVTQATIRTYMSQGLSGSETNLVSAYSFNGVATDLNTTNANNLTAQGSANATNADSPFSEDANGTPGGTYDYGIVTKVSTTVATVQVPEGCAIPTSGGVTSVSYSLGKSPYGFPADAGRWVILSVYRITSQQSAPVSGTYYNPSSRQILYPVGKWIPGHIGVGSGTGNGGAAPGMTGSLSTVATTPGDTDLLWSVSVGVANVYMKHTFNTTAAFARDITTATTYYANIVNDNASAASIEYLAAIIHGQFALL